MPDFLEIAQRMVRIPSVTGDGNACLARFLADRVLAGTDLDVRLDPGPNPRDVNLVATKALEAGPPILLNSHLDTVPPGDSAAWTSCAGDPFAARVDGDRLYGVGTADAKLDWLCKAVALRRFTGRRFSRGVIFAGTFGEESGLRGAHALVSRLPRRPIAAWAGEPSELELVTRHKGLLVVSLTARDRRNAGETVPAALVAVDGRSAHSSAPDLGDSAVDRALDLVRHHDLTLVSLHGGDAVNKVPASCRLRVVRSPAVEHLGDEPGVRVERRGAGAPLSPRLRRFLLEVATAGRDIVSRSPERDETFSPPTLTTNLGRLDAEDGEARALLDFRRLPGQESEPVIDALERFIRRFEGLDVRLEIERDNPPLDTPADSEVVVWSLTTLAALGLPTSLRTKAGCTEAGVYAAAGIPSVVLGPGLSTGNIHAPNEHVSLAALERAVEVYARLIEEVCCE